MRSSPKELFDLIDRLHAATILVVGDIILDRYVWGDVKRISPEAPVPVVNVKREEDRLGGAGNTVNNLRGIGAKVALCGFVGNDKEGQVVLALLQQLGVDTSGVIVDASKPTSLKSRIIASRQQIVRIDREDTKLPSAQMQEKMAAEVERRIEASKAILMPDYGKGTISAPILAVLEKATKNKRIGSAVRPLVVDPHPANYSHYLSLTVATPNRNEAELASGVAIVDRASAIEACRVLLKKWNAEMMMITLGEDGLVMLPSAKHDPVFIDTVAREVFDVSGAGDTVAAVFTAALAVGASPEIAGDLGNIAAGIVVSEVGTAAVTLDRLRREIEILSRSK